MNAVKEENKTLAEENNALKRKLSLTKKEAKGFADLTEDEQEMWKIIAADLAEEEHPEDEHDIDSLKSFMKQVQAGDAAMENNLNALTSEGGKTAGWKGEADTERTPSGSRGDPCPSERHQEHHVRCPSGC